jgi:hypothetical protein
MAKRVKMDVETIKRLLPCVRVWTKSGRVEEWQVYGRLNSFATVGNPLDWTQKAEVAWSTVARVINTPGAAIVL